MELLTIPEPDDFRTCLPEYGQSLRSVRLARLERGNGRGDS